jgi:putative selenium metabolism protein SsnA
MLLIVNGRVVTRDKENRFFDRGAVAVEAGLIIAVGEEAALRARYPTAELLDARGGLVMPGLINTHHHIYSALARGMSIRNYAPRGFLDILSGLWWTLDRKLNNQDNRISARLTAVDCIKNGVTTVFDHHASYGEVAGSLFTIAEELRTAGLRAVLCYETSDRDGEQATRAAITENVDFLAAAARDDSDHVAAMFGLHAAFTLSDATLARCRELLPTGAGFHIHVAEGRDDVTYSLQQYGVRVVQRLHQQGILGPQTIAAHCIHIDDAEMELLRSSDTMVVHNPESNMGNAVGCPPTLRQMERGILVGLGTDGYTGDMLESLKFANLLHKHELGDCNAAGAEAPQMLFVNNPAIAARFFTTPLGLLAPGAAADIIICDYQPITPLGADNINAHVLFGLNGHAVSMTMVAGQVLMQNRELKFIDEEAVAAQARERASRLWQRINA